ncbi:hypothetical protein, conserved [Babesia bigemina]|uniref:YTH domain-containing protein n=2 Tax=Babesia bigemina TaxID=5866 RepID=A0A061DE96_BABBI|nr:hypothetical protein, conserved [Babesia bigemina]CDR96950.1 hypothetical protein, conserved [Babesia bigemina]|eukprot:XP_012769136.1 hypothetical protein, conserved [Babesia bigemina]
MDLNEYSHKNLNHNQAKFIYENEKNYYYVVKSFSDRNVRAALEHNVWATTPKNEGTFDEAFKKCENVVLFFSINGSSRFIGYALMRSRPGNCSVQNNVFCLPNGRQFNGKQFDLLWIRVVELPFSDCVHLKNSFDDGRPVKVARDGQRIDQSTGKELCILFENRFLQKPIPWQPEMYGSQYGAYVINPQGYQCVGVAPGAQTIPPLSGFPVIPISHAPVDLQHIGVVAPYYQVPPVSSPRNQKRSRSGATPQNGQAEKPTDVEGGYRMTEDHALKAAEYNPALAIFPVDLTNLSYEHYISLYNVSHQYWIEQQEPDVKPESE